MKHQSYTVTATEALQIIATYVPYNGMYSSDTSYYYSLHGVRMARIIFQANHMAKLILY